MFLDRMGGLPLNFNVAANLNSFFEDEKLFCNVVYIIQWHLCCRSDFHSAIGIVFPVQFGTFIDDVLARQGR